MPYKNRAFWKKVALAASILIYASLFLYLNTFFNRQIAIVAVLPVMTAGAFYGFRAGIFAGILVFPGNVLLYAWSDHISPLTVLSGYSLGRLLGQLGLLLIGMVVGRMYDLGQIARNALAEREEAEQQLRQTNANLEDIIKARTAEVVKSNEELRLKIEERTQAEREISKAKESMENIFSTVIDGIIVTDARGYVVRINKTMEDILGYTQAELAGKHVVELGAVEQPYIDIASEMMEELREKGFVENHETAMTRKDGSLVQIEFNITFLKDKDGHTTGAVAGVRDISQRKKVEAELKESEERYRAFAAAATDAIVTINRAGTIVFWNPAAETIFGYPKREALGKSFEIVLPGYLQESMKQWMDYAFASADLPNPLDTFEGPGLRKDGTEVPLEMSISFWKAGQECFSTAIMRDVTLRKHAEQQLKESRDFLENIFKTSVDGILISGKHSIITMANDAAAKIMGCSKEELAGKDFTDFNLTDDDHYKENIEFITRLMEEGSVSCHEMPLLRKDGQIITVEISVALLKDRAGGVAGSVAVLRDMTDRKRAEEEKKQLEVHLRQSQKMEAIGTLAGGIAHDFNNILAAIIGYTEIAQDELPFQSKTRHNLGQVLKAADRARLLVNQILTFSRKSDLEQKPVQMHLVINEALKLLRASLPTTIEIRENITKCNDTVFADPTQIHQLIMNLCTNAAHAMQATGGILEILLAPVDLDEEDVEAYVYLKPGPYLRLTVRDTGIGIAHEIMDRIFDPFFTTKGPGQGTGMGLSVVHSIVKSHQGAIKVDSEPGKGTTFHVMLPRVDETLPLDAAAAKPRPLGTESILFVDDEEMLLDSGKNMLESLGYHVTVQQGSLEALEVFHKDPMRFDLIITDQTMPHMTGDSLAREIMRIRPDIPIILCTGYSENVSEEKARELGIRAFVMKPMNHLEIAETIRRVFDGTPA